MTPIFNSYLKVNYLFKGHRRIGCRHEGPFVIAVQMILCAILCTTLNEFNDEIAHRYSVYYSTLTGTELKISVPVIEYIWCFCNIRKCF